MTSHSDLFYLIPWRVKCVNNSAEYYANCTLISSITRKVFQSFQYGSVDGTMGKKNLPNIPYSQDLG